MVGILVLVMNGTRRTSTLQLYLPIWKGWNRKILVPKMAYQPQAINVILLMKGLQDWKRAHHHQTGESHFQLKGPLMLILGNWSRNVLQKRLVN